jgi:hypothetical protein
MSARAIFGFGVDVDARRGVERARRDRRGVPDPRAQGAAVRQRSAGAAADGDERHRDARARARASTVCA